MDEVKRALGILKNGKASGPTGIVKEILAASPQKKEVGPGKVGSGSNVDVKRNKNEGSGWK